MFKICKYSLFHISCVCVGFAALSRCLCVRARAGFIVLYSFASGEATRSSSSLSAMCSSLHYVPEIRNILWSVFTSQSSQAQNKPRDPATRLKSWTGTNWFLWPRTRIYCVWAICSLLLWKRANNLPSDGKKSLMDPCVSLLSKHIYIYI